MDLVPSMFLTYSHLFPEALTPVWVNELDTMIQGEYTYHSTDKFKCATRVYAS